MGRSSFSLRISLSVVIGASLHEFQDGLARATIDWPARFARPEGVPGNAAFSLRPLGRELQTVSGNSRSPRIGEILMPPSFIQRLRAAQVGEQVPHLLVGVVLKQ